jgi:hypothetical protein
MHQQRFLFPALVLLTVWRFALLPVHELGPEEALAVIAASQPGLNFAEIGPVVPVLVRASTAVFGQGEFGVRFFAPLLSLSVSLCLWRLARGLFDQTAAAWTLVMLNVLPVFNLAAITLAPGTAGMALTAGAALSLRIALHRSSRWHPAWWVCAVCVALAVWTDLRQSLLLLCVASALAVHRRRRHHLLRPGFGVVWLGWLLAAGIWLLWERDRAWPSFHLEEGLRAWRPAEALWRWGLWASPAALVLMAAALRDLARPSLMKPHHALVLGFALPLLFADLMFGARHWWPAGGFPSWMHFGVLALAWYSLRDSRMVPERKAAMRTAALIIAAAQSIVLMQSDMLRSAGIPWRFASASASAAGILPADPSGEMRGWRRSSEVVAGILADAEAEAGKGAWLVLTDDWRVAAPLQFYLKRRVEVTAADGNAGPFEFWPRFDAALPDGRNASGANAIFITARDLDSPPRRTAAAFERHHILSVARIMHGGNEVRALKIFACHNYRPADL